MQRKIRFFDRFLCSHFYTYPTFRVTPTDFCVHEWIINGWIQWQTALCLYQSPPPAYKALVLPAAAKAGARVGQQKLQKLKSPVTPSNPSLSPLRSLVISFHLLKLIPTLLTSCAPSPSPPLQSSCRTSTVPPIELHWQRWLFQNFSLKEIHCYPSLPLQFYREDTHNNDIL